MDRTKIFKLLWAMSYSFDTVLSWMNENMPDADEEYCKTVKNDVMCASKCFKEAEEELKALFRKEAA